MSNVYLIRHGQAGTRDNYDRLSEVGRRQSRLLGEYLAGRRIRFEAALTGGLERQMETAREVMAAYEKVGLPFPEPVVDAGWREFDLDAVYAGMAPQLCAADEDFRRQYEALTAQIEATRGEARAEVHRKWSPCDIGVMEAWIRGRFEYEGESWKDFCARVNGAAMPNSDGNAIVFTSATPTALWAGQCLDLDAERVMRIAGVLLNSSFTVLRVRDGQVRLFSLNEAPHLLDDELKTHR